jgi:hypothetical protein
MLAQYRRHSKKCTKGYRQHDRKHNNCKCVVHVEGRLTKNSEYVKESTKTRSWEEARRMIVAAEQRGKWERPTEIAVTVRIGSKVVLENVVTPTVFRTTARPGPAPTPSFKYIISPASSMSGN